MSSLIYATLLSAEKLYRHHSRRAARRLPQLHARSCSFGKVIILKFTHVFEKIVWARTMKRIPREDAP
jgi:hypothetical protein